MKFLVLSLVLVAMAQPSYAQAKYWFLNPPSKLVSCELTLKGPHQDLAQKESILPILRDVKYRVIEAALSGGTSEGLKSFGRWGDGRQTKAAKNDGVQFEEVSFDGSLERLGKSKASTIVQRLNGIEEELTKTNLDTQFFVSEIRGANVALALEQMEAHEAQVFEHYKQAKKDFSEAYMRGPMARFLFSALASSTVFFAGYTSAITLDAFLWSDYEKLTLGLKIIMLAGTYSSLSTIRDYIAVNRQRLDTGYINLKKALRNASNSPAERDHFYINSMNLLVPIEFHRHLISSSNTPLPEENVKKARELVVGAFESGELTAWERLKIDSSKYESDLLERVVTNAKDIARRGYVDHIVYFDKDTQEPVWLSFYRAYRRTPTGRKPSKPSLQREGKRKRQWLPGMVPTS